MSRSGSPPLVPIWPGARIIERNPFPFFPFNPRWQAQMTRDDLDVFCTLLKIAWISERPGFLPSDRDSLVALLKDSSQFTHVSDIVYAQFERNLDTDLLFFPPQIRALRRLVAGEDMYSLLWDESL